MELIKLDRRFRQHAKRIGLSVDPEYSSAWIVDPAEPPDSDMRLVNIDLFESEDPSTCVVELAWQFSTTYGSIQFPVERFFRMTNRDVLDLTSRFVGASNRIKSIREELRTVGPKLKKELKTQLLRG